MSEQNNNRPDDTYDLLHKNFSLFGNNFPDESDESDVKNSGEIYFSANPSTQRTKTESEYSFDRYLSSAKRQSAPSTAASYNTNANRRTSEYSSVKKPVTSSAASGNSAVKRSNTVHKSTSTGRTSSKHKKKQTQSVSLFMAVSIVVFVIVASLIIRIPIMGCVSDILAIDRDSTEIRVVLEKNSTTGEVISLLGEKDLIYSTIFCKSIAGFLGYDSDELFPAGSYDLSADMGLEGMLMTIMSAGNEEETVKVTFPEGYTVDQIVEKLAQNGVASINALYAALNDDSLYSQYEFLSEIKDRDDRYRALEGYLYPDTYEFYVDENPISVFKRFLDNFEEKWDENFADAYKGSSYSIDEIITVASILQKEAYDSEQMPLIASILYNRLNSSSFPWLNCDSTSNYIEQNKEALEEAGTYVKYLKLYDTYQVTGLPIGPICNPGMDAIAAAISPDDTDYYYFLHDKAGKIYTARTQSEHQANQKYMDNTAE